MRREEVRRIIHLYMHVYSTTLYTVVRKILIFEFRFFCVPLTKIMLTKSSIMVTKMKINLARLKLVIFNAEINQTTVAGLRVRKRIAHYLFTNTFIID